MAASGAVFNSLLNRLAHINCASIIFAYVRGSLAGLARRANHPANPPPYHFVALYEENKKPLPLANPRKFRKKPEALRN